MGTVELCTTTAREPLVINQAIHIAEGNFTSVTIGCEGQSSSDSVEPGCAINKEMSGGFVVGDLTNGANIEFVFENIIVTEQIFAPQADVSFINAGVTDSLLSITNCKFENFASSNVSVIDILQDGATHLQVDHTLFMSNDSGTIKISSLASDGVDDPIEGTFTIMNSIFTSNAGQFAVFGDFSTRVGTCNLQICA